MDTDKRKNLKVEFQCRKCKEQKPRDVSWRNFARLQVGLTPDGRFQVWCWRHDMEVFSTEPDTVRLAP